MQSVYLYALLTHLFRFDHLVVINSLFIELTQKLDLWFSQLLSLHLEFDLTLYITISVKTYLYNLARSPPKCS